MEKIVTKIIIFIAILLFFGVFIFGKDYYSNLLASLAYRKNIEEIGKGGFDNSLVLNKKGEPIIAFIDKENKLILKKKTNGIWQKKVIDKNALAGNKTSLALDSAENIYILYIDKNHSLNLVRQEKDGWIFEKVFDNASLSCNLIFDKEGILHISFWSPKNGLVYGIKKENNWKIETIDYGEVGWWNSLALDNNQNPHISYFDFQEKRLFYLFFDGKNWQKEVVDKKGEVGSWNSLAIDTENNPTISYFDETNGNLKVAKKMDGGWFIETIDKEGVVGVGTNIVLKDSQEPVVAYAGLSDNSFRVAKKTKDSWKIFIVDKNNLATKRAIKGEVGVNNSIAIDNKGNFYLLWQDFFLEELKYLKTTL